MKKRLRKKYRIGEFQELCFEISCEFNAPCDSAEYVHFCDHFIQEAIEANGLVCSGLLAPSVNLSAYINGRGKTTEAQREAVLAWLEKTEGAANIKVSELHDAWYN
jgi:uncharacterized protein YggL (DUF469 family)